ncbi:hypothetical protein [Parathalassolituus penaei]|uniref:Histidine phosphatase family protein n=1 Tax=Parathalassolituus penaei TaxID=2997323 RepID=A0A9X3EPF6_9GAMM|nr:hypothetical protein [Parathalassolituus penaei]MCY0966433.1 hypothetical protein [Parathalassolituus penaei]
MKSLLALVACLCASMCLAVEQTGTLQERQQLRNLWQRAHQPGHILLVQAADASPAGTQEQGKEHDCYKQMNLTSIGVNRSLRYYRTLRRHDLKQAMVYSSENCAAIETATRLGLGVVHLLPMLNPQLVNNYVDGLQGQALKGWIMEQPLNQPLVLVTQRANIVDLAGVVPEPDHATLLSFDENGYLVAIGVLPLLELIR